MTDPMRSAILTRLQAARPLPGTPLATRPETQIETPINMPPADLVDTFLRQWQALGGTWERHENPVAARLALMLRLREQGLSHIMAWLPEQLRLPDLSDTLADAGIQLHPPDRARLNLDLTLGLTSADAALATTGSLVYLANPDRPWLPAILPIRHFILLPSDLLFPDLPTWRRHCEATGQNEAARRTLIVTGPSYSDDIEQHVHRGMFGPASLHLLLFERTSPASESGR